MTGKQLNKEAKKKKFEIKISKRKKLEQKTEDEMRESRMMYGKTLKLHSN